MSDIFGALPLPPPAPAVGEAVTDPCLDVLLAYFAAVLNYELAVAWAAVHPRTVPNALGAAVAFTFAYDPQRGFNANKLPALYLFRAGGDGVGDWTADDLRSDERLTLRWIYPPAKQEHQILRDQFINGLTKALSRAIRDARHAGWVLAGDLADPDAIRLPAPTSTSPVTLTSVDFNGAVGAGAVVAARPFSVTTTLAVGAYNTTDPIVATGLRGGVEELFLTDPDGGETISGIWDMDSAVSFSVPAQLLATGTIALGYADSPEVGLGSLVRRAAGLTEMTMAGAGRPVPLTITVEGQEPIEYRMVEFDIRVAELLTRDLAGAHDAFADALEGRGMEAEIRHEDGTVLEIMVE